MPCEYLKPTSIKAAPCDLSQVACRDGLLILYSNINNWGKNTKESQNHSYELLYHVSSLLVTELAAQSPVLEWLSPKAE